jgi:multicomponent Na+:H+ antiporter subunit D
MTIADALRDGMAVWPVVIPLGEAACTALALGRPLVRRSVMEAAAALTLLASLLLFARLTRGGVVAMAFGGWGAPVGITFVADLLGASLCAAAGIVGLAVAVFARADVRDRRRRAGFDPLFLGMLAAVNGAFLTGDLFNLYV